MNKELDRTPSSLDKVVKSDDDVVNKVVNFLVQMNKAFNSQEYCEGINKYNVRGVYKEWARRIMEVTIRGRSD